MSHILNNKALGFSIFFSEKKKKRVKKLETNTGRIQEAFQLPHAWFYG